MTETEASNYRRVTITHKSGAVSYHLLTVEALTALVSARVSKGEAFASENAFIDLMSIDSIVSSYHSATELETAQIPTAAKTVDYAQANELGAIHKRYLLTEEKLQELKDIVAFHDIATKVYDWVDTVLTGGN